MALSNDWIVGFVDGEGCFSYSCLRNDELRFKYQIQGEFTVVQHKRDIQLLYKLKEHFGCGSVSVNHGTRWHYRVKSLDQLLTIIIPFFEKHKLQTVKKFQLPVFKEISTCLKNKEHLEHDGFEKCKSLVKRLGELKRIENS